MAELEQAGELIPNQGILINALPLLEAQASSEIDPLVHMAVMHYQFEAGLLTLPILHLSRYIIRNREDYYRLLIGVSGDKAWEPWILYVLRGVEETAAWTQGKREGIRKLSCHTAEFFRSIRPKFYRRELFDLLSEQPFCRIQNITQAGLAERHAASPYLKNLLGIGVLDEKAVGRERVFVNPKLLKLLTEEANDFEPCSEENTRKVET